MSSSISRAIELLDTIPGVDKRAAEMLLAEIGPDMSRFPAVTSAIEFVACFRLNAR